MDTAAQQHPTAQCTEAVVLSVGLDWAIVRVGDTARHTLPMAGSQAAYLSERIGTPVRISIQVADVDAPPAGADHDTVAFVAWQAGRIRAGTELAVGLTALLWAAREALDPAADADQVQTTRRHLDEALVISEHVSLADKAAIRAARQSSREVARG